jgi:PAS domain S-box-containing protein
MADNASRNTGLGATFWAGSGVLALAVGAGVYLGTAHAVDAAARARFDHLARSGKLQLDGAVRAYADVVRGLAGLFEANGGTATRLQFHRYVEALGVAEHYPALESVNFAAYVEDGARDAFVAAVRADRSLDAAGYPDFAIRPAGHRPSHTVLTYLEPLLPEKFGVDLTAGAPAVAQTMARTRDSGRMAASGKPVVVEHPVRHLGMGLRAPVYRVAAGGTVPLDVEGRRAAYVGSVGIGFSVPALVRSALPDAEGRPVALQLYAAAAAGAPGPLAVNGADSLLYDGAGPALAGGDDLLETVLPVRFDDNVWKARFVARRADLENGVLPWLAGAAGFAATLLAAVLAVRLMRARRAAEDRSRLLDLVLDHVDAAIWLQDRDRRYRYVNAKMAAFCGLPATQVVGRRDRDVLPAAQADALWESDRAVLALGEKRAARDAVAGADGVVRPLWRVTVPIGGGVEPDAVLCVATETDDVPAPQAGAPAWPETRAPRPPAAGALDGVTVLLVEDDAFHQLVARELLEDAGAQVIGVNDGTDALARLARQRVDCVLTDLHMPDMDGYEATRRIRVEPGLAGLKVIALTANGDSGEQARCVAAGMDGFVAKAAAPDTLVATVARVLGREGEEPAGALLDMRVLSDAFGGQPERMRKFAFLFLDAARDGLREIDRALAAHDVARAAAVAHRLKSTARTVGALAFGDVCADLERQDAPAAARDLAARLRGLLARLEHHIAAELGARRQDQKA